MKSKDTINEIETTVIKKAEGMFKEPSALQIAMEKESFKRSPQLYDHFEDGKFFSSVPAVIFFGFAGLMLLVSIVIVGYLIS